MCVALDDVYDNNVTRVKMSPEWCLQHRTSFISKSPASQLMCGLNHDNVPSIGGCLPLLAARHFSSQSGDAADDDVMDSDAAGADYYELFRQLMTQSQSLGNCSSLSRSVSSAERSTSSRLSHVSDSGMVKMVDIGSKSETCRKAVAMGRVRLGSTAFQLVAENRLEKGNVLSAAQLAGIMAAKQTSRLIPLCHNVILTSVDVTLTLDAASLSVVIECRARSRGRTGVEMEALTGVAVAALTVYDMCKSISHDILITDIRLVSKTGGKSNSHCR